MKSLRIIKGQKTKISLQERIAKQISRLSEKNKNDCLELIMSLEAEERLIFLNAFMIGVAALPATSSAAA